MRDERAAMHTGIAKLTVSFENVPGIPGACKTHKFCVSDKSPMATHI